MSERARDDCNIAGRRESRGGRRREARDVDEEAQAKVE